MEFTGQAFEEMQEQNIRLMQQLREKDDSNLKLMSEVNICFMFSFVSVDYPWINMVLLDVKTLVARRE